MLVEEVLINRKLSVKLGHKLVRLRDNLAPFVLSPRVGEQLTPFQYSYINGITVGITEKVIVGNQLLAVPPRPVVRDVSSAMTA